MPADHGPSRMSYSSPSGPTNPNTAPTPVNATASATAASTAGANGDQEKGDHPAFVVGPGGTFDKNKTRYVKRDLMALRTQSTEPPSDLISFKPIELLDAGPSQMRDESQRTPGKLIGRGRGRGLGRKLSDLNESSIGSPPVGRYGGRRWNSNDDERGRGRSGLSSAFEGRGVDRSPSWGSSGGLGSSMKPGGVGPTRINTLSKPKEGGEWERGMKPSVARNKADDLWDDVARVGTSKDASMDLADMAEAAARFRLEMNELMNADELKGSANAEDSKPEDIDELNKMTFDLEITPAHDSRGKSPIISNEDVLRGLNKMDEPRKSSLDTTIHAKQTPERATVASTSSSSPSISIPASSSPLRNVISSSHAEIESLSLNGRGGGLSSANDISRPATALVTLEEDEHRHGGREMLHQMNRVSMPNAENLFDFPPGISIQDTLPDPREPKTKVWYYMDPQKQIQGPFNSSRMRQWFEGRYFNVHLPLRLGNKGDFVSLGELFPNPDTAFRHIPPGLLSQYCRNNSARFRDDGSSLFSKPSVDQRFGDLGDQHGVQPSGASISGSSTKMHMGSSSVAPSSVHMMQSFSMSSENRSSLGVSAMDNRSFVDPDISDSLASKRASEPSSDYRRILYGEQNSVETHRGAQESRFLNMERTLGGESHRAGLSIPREETELSRQSFGSPMPMTGDGDRSIVMNVAASEEAVLSQEKELRRQAQLASPQTVHHQDPNRLEMAGSRSRGEDQQSMANVRPNHSPSGTIQSNMRGEANLAGTRHGMKDSMLSEELSRESKQPEHHTQLAPSPWGDAKTTPRKSLADIQREESERLQEERMEAEYKRSLEAAAAGSNGPWHMESDHPMKETPWSVEDQKQTRKASLLEIQAEEGKRKEEEKKRLAEKKDQELAAMGSQLKMMLGVGGTVAAQQGGGQEKTKLNTGSAWGVKAAPSQRKKSLLEIQAEEEKRARQQATAAASKGGGMWASLAAGRPAPMTMAQKVKRPEERNVANPWGVRQPAVNRPSAQVGSIGGPNSDNQRSLPAGEDELFWEVQPENRNESSGATENGHSQRMRNGNAISTSEDSSVAAQTKDREVTEARDRSEVFSGIPASMKPWCTERIRKLTGNDDLTLVQFCMSLEDASEIREYLAQYLGSTPEVSAFATEFINRKNAIRKDSSSTSGGPLSSAMSSASSSSTAAGAAASSSTKKSKRKKKGQRIDNSLLGITAQIPPTAEDHY